MAALKLKLLLAALLVVAHIPARAAAAEPGSKGPVILLHGLIRSPRSMQKMANKLEQAGFSTCNIGYPSTDFPIEVLAQDYVLPAIERCVASLPIENQGQPLKFVTHSLGGIVVRQLAASGALAGIQRSIGRTVMLGPPNQGSELVDKFNDWRLFNWMNGPAGLQLGTGADALPLSLGAAEFELGVIAGNGSLSLLSTLLPGEDDGKVTVASAQLAGMRDFIVLPVSHTFMMKNSEVIRRTLRFLETGTFEPAHAERFNYETDN